MTATRTITHTYTRTHTIDMLWVDVETNGVPEDGTVVPLEIGLMLTDKAGNEIDSFSSIVMPYDWRRYMYQALPVVKDMHKKSGLIADLEAAEAEYGIHGAHRRYRTIEIETRILVWLDQHDIAQKTLPMTGSTVGFDRAVLVEHFLQLHSVFHYRNQDISTLKNLCKLHNPRVYSRLPKDANKKHRVLDDIRASIREYQFYLENFLFTEE